MRVTDITPPEGATDVALGTPIVVTFSQPLDPDSVGEGAFVLYANGNPLAKSVSLSPDHCAVTLELRLPPASTVILTIQKHLRDAEGAPLETTRARFSTVAKARLGDPGTEHKALGAGQWLDWFRHNKRAACEAMFHLGADDIPVLIEVLALEDGQADMEARRVLARIGAPACAPLAEAMKTAGDRMQTLIAVIFSWIGPQTVPLLIGLLDSENERRRRAAVLALDHFGPKASAAKPRLDAMLDEPTLASELEALVVEALWKLDPDEAQAAHLFEVARARADIDGLAARLRGDDRAAVLAAARELGKLREMPDVAVPILVAALTDATEEEKLAAIAALQEYGPLAAPAIPSLIDELRRHEVCNPRWLSGDGNPKRALVMTGAEAIEPMVELLQRAPESHLRRRAARILGAMLEEPTESEVNRRLAGHKHGIREREPEVVAALRQAALEDPVRSVRGRAANGLSRAPSIAAKVHHIEVLLETARLEDGWAKLEGPITSWTNLDSRVIETLRQCDRQAHDQLVAITTRHGVSAEALAKALARTLVDEAAAKGPERLESTLRALGRFGQDVRAAEPQIREFIEHEDPAIRAAAQDAIANLV